MLNNAIYFPEQPDNVPIERKNDGKTLYRLRRDFIYEWFDQKDNKTKRIVAKRGFLNDGASVPNIVGWLIKYHPDGLHRAAAIIHDYLYQYKGVLPENTYFENKENVEGKVFKRKEADLLFKQILKESGVSAWRCNLSYWAVRIGGRVAWDT